MDAVHVVASVDAVTHERAHGSVHTARGGTNVQHGQVVAALGDRGW